ncbi:MAG: site-specific integrase [Clostridia bacterium]|nr:site-specific integrase [Clostridia bacterium]
MAKNGSKRAAHGSGTIRQRKDGTWEARFTVGRDPGSGKQRQKSVYGKTEAEVAQKLRTITHEIDAGAYKEPSRMTVNQWLKIWLEEYTGSVKENTLVSYRVQVEHNIVPAIGALKLSGVQPHHIQAAINKLSKRTVKPLSAKSVKNVFGVLHKAMGQAVLNGYLTKNPCDGVQLPRVTKKEILPLNETEIHSFLGAIKGHRNEIVFRVALFTGMREAELMGLTWDRIDFKAGTILVDRQMIHEKKKGGAYKFAPTKTSNIRRIRPASVVMSWLQAWKKEQAVQRLSMGEQWNKDFENLVFTDPLGRHLSNTTLTHEAKRLGEKIGKPGFRFHDLRHSYATAAIRAGDDLKSISTNLGHASISITMDVYAAFTEDMARASSQRMDSYMKVFGL